MVNIVANEFISRNQTHLPCDWALNMLLKVACQLIPSDSRTLYSKLLDPLLCSKMFAWLMRKLRHTTCHHFNVHS